MALWLKPTFVGARTNRKVREVKAIAFGLTVLILPRLVRVLLVTARCR